MLTFFIKQWRLFCLLLLALLWIVAFPIWGNLISRDLLNVPITLAPPGTVEKHINVEMPENYSLHFMFERNGIAVQELNRSIGDMGLCNFGERCSKGVPIPIRWSLTSNRTGAVVAGGERESRDSSAWSDAHVYRSIATINVQPDSYVFRAEVIQPVPALAEMQTHIAIQLQPKSSTTWQMGVVWSGAIGQYLLAWPAAISACILLLMRAGLTLRSIGTARKRATP